MNHYVTNFDQAFSPAFATNLVQPLSLDILKQEYYPDDAVTVLRDRDGMEMLIAFYDDEDDPAWDVFYTEL